MKVVRITFYQKFTGPMKPFPPDVNFQLQRRACVVDTFENFVTDWTSTDFTALEVGESLTIEVLEMDKTKFEKLREFNLPAR